MSLDQRIERADGICGGKPRIAGHRITVQDIAGRHERLGWSVDQIASEYDLSLAEVYAGISLTYGGAGSRVLGRSTAERSAPAPSARSHFLSCPGVRPRGARPIEADD